MVKGGSSATASLAKKNEPPHSTDSASSRIHSSGPILSARSEPMTPSPSRNGGHAALSGRLFPSASCAAGLPSAFLDSVILHGEAGAGWEPMGGMANSD